MDVLTLFANSTVRDIGAVAIVALVVLMILTGRLVPKATHERELAASNKRGDEWKQTAKVYESANAVQAEQISKFADAGLTNAEFYGTVMRDGGGRRVGQTDTT